MYLHYRKFDILRRSLARRQSTIRWQVIDTRPILSSETAFTNLHALVNLYAVHFSCCEIQYIGRMTTILAHMSQNLILPSANAIHLKQLKTQRFERELTNSNVFFIQS